MSEDVDNHVSCRYQIKRRLGKGAYGIVWKAVDKQNGNQIVALKKIFDAFRNQTDSQRTFREIMLLLEFRRHPNIIKLLRVIRATGDRDIYLIFEHMDTDLHNVIKKGDILKPVHIQFIMYQLFCAVLYLHSANVIHRDLKPSNVLLDVNCTVKLADFGLARSLQQINTLSANDLDGSAFPELTEYVATRWYRAPEILLSSKYYTKGVDMWSLGCILGEMLNGKPLFPGTSTINQIEKIIEVISPPSASDIDSIGSKYAAAVLKTMVNLPTKTIESTITKAPCFALDLIKRLLVFNPNKRLSIEESLRHPYVRLFHNPSEEFVMDHKVKLSLNDDVQLSINEYRNKLYELIQRQDFPGDLDNFSIQPTLNQSDKQFNHTDSNSKPKQSKVIKNRTLKQEKEDSESMHSSNAEENNDNQETVRPGVAVNGEIGPLLKRSNYFKSFSKGSKLGADRLPGDGHNKSVKNKANTNESTAAGQFFPFLQRARSVEVHRKSHQSTTTAKGSADCSTTKRVTLNSTSKGAKSSNGTGHAPSRPIPLSETKATLRRSFDSTNFGSFWRRTPSESRAKIPNDWTVITRDQLKAFKELTLGSRS
ncbi:putative serine/threonine-protein kinase C05D10.2 [Trichinella murrelli]|uniref:Mitogen-activated protein kinase n=1 Tax=Trichinella murrelli TaxID=144512 RepID=A0A0V0TK65_9BILA|nr:putative serine/threonine-protein kinase C05D10.2 [Trichinella murrelli]